MARIEKVFASGTIANVIFYELNGKPCARSKPALVQQTTATKKAAGMFGVSKTLSRLLRQSLSSVLPHYSGKELMYRVDKGTLGWMKAVECSNQDITPLPGFACDVSGDYSKSFPIPITAAITGTTLQVSVPVIEGLTNAANSNKALLTLVVSCVDPQAGAQLRTEQQTIEVNLPPLTHGTTSLSFAIVLQKGVFVTLSAALSWLGDNEVKEIRRENKNVRPVAVLQGWYCEK